MNPEWVWLGLRDSGPVSTGGADYAIPTHDNMYAFQRYMSDKYVKRLFVPRDPEPVRVSRPNPVRTPRSFTPPSPTTHHPPPNGRLPPGVFLLREP